MKLLLCRFGVGVIARLNIIVLRGEAQIIFRRSGRCSLLIARWDGRLDSIETGLKIHSETARISGPTCLTSRKLLCLSQLLWFHILFSFIHYFQSQTICILQLKRLCRTAYLHAARGRTRGKRKRGSWGKLDKREKDRERYTKRKHIKSKITKVKCRSKMPTLEWLGDSSIYV